MPRSNASEDPDTSMMDDMSATSTEDDITSRPPPTTLPVTPGRNMSFPVGEPTPPGSETRVPTTASANANGKRPVNVQSGKATHSQQQSQQELNELEDGPPPDEVEESQEPGANWLRKKHQDEMRKNWEMVIDREFMIKKRYGDVVLDHNNSQGNLKS